MISKKKSLSAIFNLSILQSCNESGLKNRYRLMVVSNVNCNRNRYIVLLPLFYSLKSVHTPMKTRVKWKANWHPRSSKSQEESFYRVKFIIDFKCHVSKRIFCVSSRESLFIDYSTQNHQSTLKWRADACGYGNWKLVNYRWNDWKYQTKYYILAKSA